MGEGLQDESPRGACYAQDTKRRESWNEPVAGAILAFMGDDILVTRDAAIATAMCGELVLIAVGDKDITDASWSEYIGFCERLVKAHGRLRICLNYSPVKAPNARQRSMLSQRVGDAMEKFERVAVLSDSLTVRGAIRALAWLRAGQVQMRPFKSRETGAAFEFLNAGGRFDVAAAAELLERMIALVFAPAVARTG